MRASLSPPRLAASLSVCLNFGATTRCYETAPPRITRMGGQPNVNSMSPHLLFILAAVITTAAFVLLIVILS
jgi:hypothetical protein